MLLKAYNNKCIRKTFGGYIFKVSAPGKETHELSLVYDIFLYISLYTDRFCDGEVYIINLSILSILHINTIHLQLHI